MDESTATRNEVNNSLYLYMSISNCSPASSMVGSTFPFGLAGGATRMGWPVGDEPPLLSSSWGIELRFLGGVRPSGEFLRFIRKARS